MTEYFKYLKYFSKFLQLNFALRRLQPGDEIHREQSPTGSDRTNKSEFVALLQLILSYLSSARDR